MLGLRVDVDTTQTNKIGYQKSFKFASQLSGRFFVSGVSGSFHKHTKSLLREIKKENEAKKKYVNAPEVVQKANDDLNKDAILLLQLEERLAEIRKEKEMRRKRDRLRKRRKLEYDSAVSIQRYFRSYFYNHCRPAVDCIVAFIRSLQARQALSAASWAAAIIKRFAIRASYVWKARSKIKDEIRIKALNTWRVAKEHAMLTSIVRSQFSSEFVNYCLHEATKVMAWRQKQIALLSSPKKKGGKKNMKMHSSKQLLKIAEGDTKQPFFLTAFGNDINEDDTFSSGNSLDSPLRSLNGSQGFSPSKWKSDAEDTGTKLTSTTTTTDVDPSLNERDNSYSRIICSKAKQPEEGDRRFKFGSLHGERLREMELERHRRLKAIELQKIEKERLEKSLRDQEEALKLAKIKKRQDFLQKLDDEHLQNARLAAKARIEKEKMIKEETEERNKERLDEKRRIADEIKRRNVEQAHKNKMRAIAKQAMETDPVALAAKAAKELADQEEKRRRDAEQLMRYREALARRVEEKTNQDIEKRKIAELEAHSKEQRRLAVAKQAQESLARAKKVEMIHKEENGSILNKKDDRSMRLNRKKNSNYVSESKYQNNHNNNYNSKHASNGHKIGKRSNNSKSNISSDSGESDDGDDSDDGNDYFMDDNGECFSGDLDEAKEESQFNFDEFMDNPLLLHITDLASLGDDSDLKIPEDLAAEDMCRFTGDNEDEVDMDAFHFESGLPQPPVYNYDDNYNDKIIHKKNDFSRAVLTKKKKPSLLIQIEKSPYFSTNQFTGGITSNEKGASSSDKFNKGKVASLMEIVGRAREKLSVETGDLNNSPQQELKSSPIAHTESDFKRKSPQILRNPSHTSTEPINLSLNTSINPPASLPSTKISLLPSALKLSLLSKDQINSTTPGVGSSASEFNEAVGFSSSVSKHYSGSSSGAGSGGLFPRTTFLQPPSLPDVISFPRLQLPSQPPTISHSLSTKKSSKYPKVIDSTEGSRPVDSITIQGGKDISTTATDQKLSSMHMKLKALVVTEKERREDLLKEKTSIVSIDKKLAGAKKNKVRRKVNSQGNVQFLEDEDQLVMKVPLKGKSKLAQKSVDYEELLNQECVALRERIETKLAKNSNSSCVLSSQRPFAPSVEEDGHNNEFDTAENHDMTQHLDASQRFNDLDLEDDLYAEDDRADIEFGNVCDNLFEDTSRGIRQDDDISNRFKEFLVQWAADDDVLEIPEEYQQSQ